MRVRRVLLHVVAVSVAVLTPVLLAHRWTGAQPVPYGTVLVAGSDWAGASAAVGDLNVYSNGDGNRDAAQTYGLEYECVELAQRWAAVRFGAPPIWPVAYAYQMWDVGPRLKVPWQQLPNGGAVAPQYGDLLVFGGTSSSPAGHVAVVASAGPDHVDVVEQNWALSNPSGRARLPLAGTTMPSRLGMPVLGWLRASVAPRGLRGADGPGGFALDGYGGVHPWGSAAPLAQAVSWPGWDIARGVAVQPGGTGGYVLDGWGGIHRFGGAPMLDATASWPGRDIARGIALRPDGLSGYVLDGWGGVHPFGGAPAVATTASWPGWDIARSITLRPDGVSGYVLDGWGGVHPFGGAPVLATTTSWPGWDIARGLALRPDGRSGWVVDGWNGIHPFGDAPPLSSTAYFAGQDIARGISVVDAGGGYTITAWGRVREFGDAPPVSLSAAFDDPVARGMG
jgi:DNA-binding beta-propeller fold protein YncE